MQKTEHRVTLTVTFIVTMFTLTNGPSALVHLVMYATHEELYDLTMISRLVTSSEELCRFFFFLVLHTRSSYLFKTAKCETSSFSRLGSS
uniref:Uncharacterized protein n=1 Tax=Caenorhabditis japonica TaxID=281687 RepID=A0A8R1IMQ7_CAEJA